MKLGRGLIFNLVLLSTLLSCKADPLRAPGPGLGYQPANLNPTTDPTPTVDPSVTPSAIPDALPADNKFTNADGSITIMNPRFVFNGTEKKLITAFSSYTAVGKTQDGICALHGMPQLVATTYGAVTSDGVQLTKEGRLVEQASSYGHKHITSVTCSSGAITSTGNLTNQSKNVNSDGSVTVTEPRFRYNNKEERLVEGVTTYYNAKKSANGVCRQFLMLKVVSATYSSTKATDGIELTEYGQFKGYVNNTPQSTYYYITSVTCSN